MKICFSDMNYWLALASASYMMMQAAPKSQSPQPQDESLQSWHGPLQLKIDQVFQPLQALQLPYHTFSSSPSLVSDIGAAVGMPPRRGLGAWFSTCHRFSQPIMAECVADWEERASTYPYDWLRKARPWTSSTVADGLHRAMSVTGWATAANLRIRDVRKALHRPAR